MTMEQTRADCPASRPAIDLASDVSRLDPAIHNDPFPFYRALRRDAPIHFDAKLNMYLVSRYQDVQAVLRDAETYSLELGYHGQFARGFRAEYADILEREGGGFFRDVIACDPPAHTRLRRLLEKAFSAHRVKALEPRIRQIVVNILEPLAERGGGDGIHDIGAPLTARLICEQLGFDYDEVGVETLKRWGRAHLAQLGGMQSNDEMPENARAVCEMQNYIIPRIREREIAPRDDMMSDLVHARLDDETKPELDFEEKVSCIRALLIAGNDTTAAALANLLLVLATQPALAMQLREAADDERVVSRFVEEVLRIEPPVHGLFRVTTRATELGGVHLPVGSGIHIIYASANDDEAEFPCPRMVDMNRPNIGASLTFGGGIHRCIGAALARMQIRVAAQEVLRRLDDIALAIPLAAIRYHPTLSSQTIERLPLTFRRRN